MSRSTKTSGAIGQVPTNRPPTMTAIGDRLRRPKGHLARLVAQTDKLSRANKVFHAYLPTYLQQHACLSAIGPQGWIIQTESPVWATRLRYVLPSLQQQLNDHFGHEIPPLSVRIRPGAVVNPAPQPEPPSRRMTMTQESASLLTGAAQGIEDQRLGAALLRLAERAQQRSR